MEKYKDLCASAPLRDEHPLKTAKNQIYRPRGKSAFLPNEPNFTLEG